MKTAHLAFLRTETVALVWLSHCFSGNRWSIGPNLLVPSGKLMGHVIELERVVASTNPKKAVSLHMKPTDYPCWAVACLPNVSTTVFGKRIISDFLLLSDLYRLLSSALKHSIQGSQIRVSGPLRVSSEPGFCSLARATHFRLRINSLLFQGLCFASSSPKIDPTKNFPTDLLNAYLMCQVLGKT